MATPPVLSTYQTQLAEIERRRELAQAMQAQSLKMEPIGHPLQGWAKLAQAWLGARAMRKLEDEEEGSRAAMSKAIADALNPYTEKTVGYDPTATPQGVTQNSLTDVDRSGVWDFQARGTPVTEKVRKTDEEWAQGIASVNPEWSANFQMQQRLQKPTNPYGNGKLVEVTFPGGRKDEMLLDQDQRTGAWGYIDQNGQRQNIPGDWIGPTVQQTKDVGLPPLSANDVKDIEKLVTEVTVGFDQIDRLRNGIMEGGLMVAEGGPAAGRIRNAVVQLTANMKALYHSVYGAEGSGEVYDYGSGRWVRDDYGSMTDVRRYNNRPDRYSADYWSQRDIDKYGDSKMQSNWDWFKSLDAIVQANGVAVAYTLARMADPGGRLSEMDVINQMRALQLDGADTRMRLQALAEAERTFATAAYTRVGFAKNRWSQYNPDTPLWLPEGFDERLERGRFADVTERNRYSELQETPLVAREVQDLRRDLQTDPKIDPVIRQRYLMIIDALEAQGQPFTLEDVMNAAVRLGQ